jgi:release factor glutamine methyltransferase
VYFCSHPFDIFENVYEPAEDSFLFAENLDVADGAEVLDMGVGCGLLAVVAAQKARAVLAVDINPYAIRCAKANSALNDVRGKMAFLQADLFSALSNNARFNLILFNAPYLPSEESEEASWLGRSWAGGASGRKVIDSFISQTPAHLRAGGRVLLMQSTLAGVKETLLKFEEYNLKAAVKVERSLPFFETLTLIEAMLY